MLPIGPALRHQARVHAAVGAAVAVATAVVVGALLVGVALRASLRERALGGLGRLDAAVFAESFFADPVAGRVASALEGRAEVAPLLLLQGTAARPGGVGSAGAGRAAAGRAGGVTIAGVDAAFAASFGVAEPAVPADQRPVFPPAWIGAGLAAELGLAAGDDLVIGVPRWSEIPAASLLARRDTTDRVRTLRVSVVEVLAAGPDPGSNPGSNAGPTSGLGAFALAPSRLPGRNVFLRRADLARALGRPGEVNVLVARASATATGAPDRPAAAATTAAERSTRLAADLTAALRGGAVTPADLGLAVRPRGAALELASRSFLLTDATVDAGRAFAARRDLVVQPTLTYLANALRRPATGAAVPYSTVLAVDPARLLPGELFVDPTGAPIPALAEDAILLGEWAARDLSATVGEELELDYFAVGPGDQLVERTARLRVAGVVAQRGLAADRTLLPEVPGISDARSLAEWEAPFPFELARVRPQDEDFWRDYGPTPKAFVALATGQRLFGSRHGQLTSLRMASARAADAASAVATAGTATGVDRAPPADAPVADGPADGAADLAADLTAALATDLDPAAHGWRVVAVRADAQRAAAGSSDFAGLFVAFSMFVLVSALLLVALLFALGVETRAREVGTLLAVGYPRRRIGRQLLAEGAVVALLGALAGVALGVGYAGLLLLALRTWWRQAIGPIELALVVDPTSLGVGAVVGLLVALAAMRLRLRVLTRVAPRALLAGAWAVEPSAPASRPAGDAGRRVRTPLRARWPTLLAGALALIALALTVAALRAPGGQPSPGLAFGAGAALLVAGILAVGPWCARRSPGRAGGPAPIGSLLAMATATAARAPGRTRLAVSLVAVAVFVLATVAASRHDSGGETGREGGLGGYDLLASADVPLLRDLASPADQEALGLDDETLAALAASTVTPFAVLPGDDTSCLNLFQPARPRLLGVPPAQRERGGFRFASTVEPVENPWRLLERDLGPGVVPAIGDASSVQWILKSGLGKDVVITDERGQPLRLRIVALLSRSLFQSELLVAEEALRRHFPSTAGSAFFLLETAADRRDALVAGLEEGLAAYGVDAAPAADRLAAYLAVENTYMAAFGVLGGLGLLLGTLGLAVLLVRGVEERRAELAALAACGFPRARVTRLVLLETTVLLAAGTLLGLLAGLLAALPYLLARGEASSLGGLLTTVLAVWAVGGGAAWLASRRAVPRALVAAMRGE